MVGGIDAGDVYLDVKPSLAGFNTELAGRLGGLKGAAEGVLRPFGLSLGQAATAGVGVAVVKMVGSAVAAFREAEQVSAQTAAVIESTGGVANVSADAVAGYADTMRDLTGIEDEAVAASENLLLTFRNITDEAGASDTFSRTETAVLDMATAMNQGAIPSMEQLKSTTIAVGKAVNDPIKGMTALQRVGVTFSESQRTQIEAMIEANDLMGAQGVILTELEGEFGGAAEAAGSTFSGSLAKLESKFGDVQEKIGEAVIPVLDKLLDLANLLVPALGFVADNLDLVLTTALGFAVLKYLPELLFQVALGLEAIGASSAAAAAASGAAKVATALGSLGPAALVAADAVGVAYLAYKVFTGADPTFVPELSAALVELAGTSPIVAEGLGMDEKALEGVAGAASRAHRRLIRFAGMTRKELATWEEDVAGSLDFAQQAFDELGSRAHVSARNILRSLREANRAQQKFAEDAQTFLGDVADNLGPGMRDAAEELVASLAASGTEGAARLDALAGASTEMKKRILKEFLESDQGAQDFASSVVNATTEVNNLDGALDRLPKNVYIRIVGIPEGERIPDNGNTNTNGTTTDTGPGKPPLDGSTTSGRTTLRMTSWRDGLAELEREVGTEYALRGF